MGIRAGGWVATAATAVWLAGAAVPAGADGAAPQIVNGNPTQQEVATGALLRRFGFGLGATCSGTLVGCRSFVTAAHCVCPGDNPCQVDPKPLRVFLQHAGIFEVERVDVNPSFAFGLRNDVAVVTLKTDVEGVPPAAINTVGTPSHGTSGTIVGFGVSRGTLDDGGIKRQGRVALSSCAAAPFPVPAPAHLCWSFSGPLGPAGTDSNTCVGDSGGPLFVDLGAGPVLAGVTSGGSSADCLPDDVSFDANVFENRAFISDVAGSDLGATCGAMAPVGTSATAVIAAGTATLTKATQQCRKEVGRQIGKLVRAEIKALRRCLDAVAAGRASGPCPDTAALTELAKARAKVDAAKLARPCPDGVVEASLLGGACASATDAGQVRACVLDAGGAAASALLVAAYGDPGAVTVRPDTEAKCQKAAGASLAKYATARMRAEASCRANADKGRVDGCPDARVATKVARAASKLESGVTRRCADAQVAGLAAGGAFGAGCQGAGTAAQLVACLLAQADGEVDGLQHLTAAVQAGSSVRVDVPEGTQVLRVVLNAIDPAQSAPNDLDLYLRRGAPASVALHDAASTDGGVFEAVAVALPAPGPWFVHVEEVAGGRVPFQVTATLFGP